MAEQAFHGHYFSARNVTHAHDHTTYPSSSYSSTSSSPSGAAHAASLPSTSSASSYGQEDAAAEVEVHHRHHQRHHHGYGYLHLIDELRTCAKLKAEIVAHPLFEKLLWEHVQCLSMGMPAQQLPALEAQLALKHNVILKYVMYGNNVDNTSSSRAASCNQRQLPPPPTLRHAREIDAFMENYLQLLLSWKERFLPATVGALSALSEMEKSFRDLTGVSLNLHEANARMDQDMEDMSCVDGDFDCDIDRALLDHVRMELKHKLKESYRASIIAIHEEILRKRQAGKLPGDITALKIWWDAHQKWPYPTEAEKRKLVEETGLEMRQVNNWFINHRKRNWIERCPPPATTTVATGCSPHSQPENPC